MPDPVEPQDTTTDQVEDTERVSEVDDQENDIDRESLRLNRLRNGANHCASQENQSNLWPHVLTDVIFNLMITIINVIMCVPCLYG